MYILSARKYLSQFVGIPFDNFWPPKHSEIPAKPTYPVGTIDRYPQKPAIHGQKICALHVPQSGWEGGTTASGPTSSALSQRPTSRPQLNDPGPEPLYPSELRSKLWHLGLTVGLPSVESYCSIPRTGPA